MRDRLGIDGIIMVPSPGENQFNPADLRVPVVVMDWRLRIGAADTVLIENRRSAREGVEHLLDHAYTSVYCLSTYTGQDFTNAERIAGYEDAMCARGRGIEVMADLNTPELVVAAIRRIWMTGKGRTAIFTTHNLATVQVLSVLFDLGVKVPKEIALLGFDDVPMATMIRPSPTVIRQPAAELAQQAARLLFSHIDSREPRTASAITLTWAPRSLLGNPVDARASPCQIDTHHLSAAPESRIQAITTQPT